MLFKAVQINVALSSRSSVSAGVTGVCWSMVSEQSRAMNLPELHLGQKKGPTTVSTFSTFYLRLFDRVAVVRSGF